MSALGVSFAKQIKSNKSLYRALKPVANWYANLTGYRQHGLKYDDLVVEENPTVQKAISRLSEREQYDRAYRMRVAFQLSILHTELPKDQWTKPEEDQRYLTPLIKEIEAENKERELWDTAEVKKTSNH
ncbi:cytochrome b-c1 complex subunit 7 [Phakopsora pachyrhizi]|uniref:Cytochrome b-c1 complex subunit 7 n=1 Tax=Phakopsora pachyrhizi TaxID=170000 RepID=A0AAV0AET9_PHAPC|nr:cytochrome b-c1 complex subunit 7 [Phakopsora pachyrhizi]CAH7666095.1 cytochrome b-c1 complex subunit 7 [Phakopsora pachyrhizi]